MNSLENLKKNCSIPRRKRHSLVDWFKMTEQEVLDTFAAEPNAIKLGEGDEQFVYIPGTRKNKVLLVAHADTVFGDNDLSVGYKDFNYFSLTDKVGIGADDRAGCAILWNLRRLGHSILIPNAEEKHCVGSQFLLKQEGWREVINDHQFAIQFDRMNGRDIVTYDVGTNDFVKYLEQNITGYKASSGSFTDIKMLFDKYKHEKENRVICAANISIGYYGQHFDRERLDVREWNRTLSLIHKFLSKEDLQKFVQSERYQQSPSYPTQYTNYNNNHRRHWDNNSCVETVKTTVDSEPKQSLIIRLEDIVICPHCELYFDKPEAVNNGGKCVGCKRFI